MASTVFSLDDTPVNQRFSHFREVVESFYIPIGLECEHPERFNAWVTGSELGEVSVGTCFLAEQRVSRKPEHIARSEDDRIKLILPLSGAIASHQDGNDVVVRRGEFYITDPTRPYEEQILEDLTFIYLLLLASSRTPGSLLISLTVFQRSDLRSKGPKRFRRPRLSPTFSPWCCGSI
jgi:hypothetical protein